MYITQQMRKAVVQALGYGVSGQKIEDDLFIYQNYTDDEVREHLAAKERKLADRGGRGTHLADAIDSLRTVLAARTATPDPHPEVTITLSKRQAILVDIALTELQRNSGEYNSDWEYPMTEGEITYRDAPEKAIDDAEIDEIKLMLLTTVVEGDVVQGHYRVEYDLAYTGGDYTGAGEVAQVPVSLVEAMPPHLSFESRVRLAFRKATGHDPIHIIHFSNEVITADA